MSKDVNDIDFKDLEKYLPESIFKLLDKRNATAILLDKLPEEWTPEDVSPRAGQPKTIEQRLWELIGLSILNKYGPHEALAIFMALYDHMLIAQEKNKYRVHKGMPLLWVSECFYRMGFHVHTKRYLMLTLCEDALTYNEGEIDPDTSGTYFRLVWLHGIPDSEYQRYSREIYSICLENPELSLYPEWVLQEIDQDWMTEYPSLDESSRYFITKRYLHQMIGRLGEPTGKELERLGSYLLSCIPDFRATMRRRSRSTDYDIVCAVDGLNIDFRSDIGRYFVCECKDLDKAADFSVLAKFCRVLDSVKCKFGIIFSTNGISGSGRGTYAEREQMKVFQDRGLIIIVIDRDDFRSLAEGLNFVSLLRDKYEKVRLDLL